MEGSGSMFRASSFFQDDVAQMALAIVVIGLVFTLLTLDLSLLIKAAIGFAAVAGGVFTVVFRK